MKVFKILFLLLTVMLISCSDDDNDSIIAADIVGNWDMISYDYTGTTSTGFQGQNINSNLEANAFDIDYQISFSENPNVVTSQGDFGLTVQATTLGQTTTETLDNVSTLVPEGTETSAEWSLNGNQLTLMTSNRTDVFTVQELTETTLLLFLNVNETIDVDGLSVNTNLFGEIRFTRL